METFTRSLLLSFLLAVPCLPMPIPENDIEEAEEGSHFTFDDNSFFTEKLSAFGEYLFGEPSNETGKMVEEWDSNSGINPEELGEYVEGDILFPLASGRNGIRAEVTRWPNGIVYYKIAPSFSKKDVDLMHEAFRQYHELTCIRFEPYTGKEQDYVYVTRERSGCWSSVGRAGGYQQLNLQSPGCTGTLGTPIHEFMHALGFLHEQNRWERDRYVTINWPNIQSGTRENFRAATKEETIDFGVQYDYKSVMHYSANAFSVNGKPTIVPKKKVELGQRKGLSKNDVEKINRMYNCKKTGNFTSSISFIDSIASFFSGYDHEPRIGQ